jgi:hypothetical protein
LFCIKYIETPAVWSTYELAALNNNNQYGMTEIMNEMTAPVATVTPTNPASKCEAKPAAPVTAPQPNSALANPPAAQKASKRMRKH